jgi:hypothetical protein
VIGILVVNCFDQLVSKIIGESAVLLNSSPTRYAINDAFSSFKDIVSGGLNR